MKSSVKSLGAMSIKRRQALLDEWLDVVSAHDGDWYRSRIFATQYRRERACPEWIDLGGEA